MLGWCVERDQAGVTTLIALLYTPGRLPNPPSDQASTPEAQASTKERGGSSQGSKAEGVEAHSAEPSSPPTPSPVNSQPASMPTQQGAAEPEARLQPIITPIMPHHAANGSSPPPMSSTPVHVQAAATGTPAPVQDQPSAALPAPQLTDAAPALVDAPALHAVPSMAVHGPDSEGRAIASAATADQPSVVPTGDAPSSNPADPSADVHGPGLGKPVITSDPIGATVAQSVAASTGDALSSGPAAPAMAVHGPGSDEHVITAAATAEQPAASTLGDAPSSAPATHKTSRKPGARTSAPAKDRDAASRRPNKVEVSSAEVTDPITGVRGLRVEVHGGKASSEREVCVFVLCMAACTAF